MKKVLQKVNDFNSLLGLRRDPLSDLKTEQFGPAPQMFSENTSFIWNFPKKTVLQLMKQLLL